jgi:hypothetical protein
MVTGGLPPASRASSRARSRAGPHVDLSGAARPRRPRPPSVSSGLAVDRGRAAHRRCRPAARSPPSRARNHPPADPAVERDDPATRARSCSARRRPGLSLPDLPKPGSSRHSRSTVLATASDGSIVEIDWGGLRAIPPPLRPALATQLQRLVNAGARPHDPLLPGTSHGRMSAPEIQRALDGLDAPTSMWQDPSDEYFDGPGLDGRTILHTLSPALLFPTTND